MQHSKLSDYKPNNYKQNLDYFNTYKLNHRQHQRAALLATAGFDVGQVLSPCGTGKTRIQISLHVQSMIDLFLANSSGIHVIASHRLALNTQLLDELVHVATNTGLPFDVLYIGSYKSDLSKYYTKYFSLGYTPKVSRHLISTNKQEITDFLLKSQELNRNVIVASTYHSFNLLDSVESIQLVTFDEAQNTLSDDFKANIEAVKPVILNQFYFTATRKVRGDDGGMNDKTFYGDVLYDAPPKLMLTEGEIACPKLHIIDGEEDKTFQTTNTHMLVKNTIEAFVKHKDLVKSKSASPEDIGAKLLISANGIEEMERISFEPVLAAFAQINKIKIFAISSDGCHINGNKCSGRNEFFIKLKALEDPEDALIFNVDILTEGIDLPSITGVMPLRNLPPNKLIQLNGRCLRLHKKDRAKLYAGDIIPGNYKTYIKPYGYLIIPRHMASLNEHQAMIDIVRAIMKEYETPAEELVIQEKYIDPNNEVLESMIKKEFSGGSDYDLIHTEQTIVDEAELQQFRIDLASLNDAGRLNYLQGMLA
jgi:predicted helicase